LYRVDNGDFLNAIAHKFGTTLKHLLMLNADLNESPESPLEVGAAT
jgi:LysM repeat protein